MRAENKSLSKDRGDCRKKVYYCHPYSSYERGSNENLNKMIRRWLPKGTNFDEITGPKVDRSSISSGRFSMLSPFGGRFCAFTL